MVEKEAEKQKHSLRNVKLKANRASVTEEQRRERLRIRREKDRARRRSKNLKEEEEKVISNKRLRETAPGHSQKFEAR